MPAVQEILSSINHFAQARLPVMAGWRSAGLEAGRSFLTGRMTAPVQPDRPDPPESEYAHAGPEPLLEEMLCDPVVQLIMRADGVQAADLQIVLDAAERHRGTPPADCAAIDAQ
jgi:hypothetical protein